MAMAVQQPRMTARELTGLLDIAMSMPDPVAYLDGAASLFGLLGRHDDAYAAAWMGILAAGDEIEILMSLRAAWCRGEARSPVGMVDSWR